MARKPVEPVTEVETAEAAAETSSDGLTPVRTTINPREVIRVGDAELLDLERQGLIYSGTEYDEPADDEGEAVSSGVVTDSAPIVPSTGGTTDETEGGAS